MKQSPFEVMVTGEKRVEFREKKAWISSRLVDSKSGIDREYDIVEFTNGYGEQRPRFTVSYKGYALKEKGVHATYSNGLKVDENSPTYVIFLGDDIVRKNC